MSTQRAASPFPPFWASSPDDQLGGLDSSPQGLTETQARERLDRYGPNRLHNHRRAGDLGLLLAQFKSPITLILIGSALLSVFLHDRTDAMLILVIVGISALLGFWQERGAAHALESLLAMVRIKTRVVRNQREEEIPVDEIVPGDVLLVATGATVAGDCLLLEAKDLFVNEASLTGETYPVEKSPGILPPETPLARRTNTLFSGTHVVSGNGKAVVVATGQNTEFGKVSEHLRLRPPETEFERGVRRFGYFLLEVTLLLIGGIFVLNVYLHHPASGLHSHWVMEAFMFSLALAVGLTPQLLPAIISVNLAYGAKRMAAHQVIVRRLASIENFGSMDVLCSDKTGTLTEGKVRIHAAIDFFGRDHPAVLRLAYLNAVLQTGFANPIDDAIRSFPPLKLPEYQKLDEVPYDFVRKRLSILAILDGRHLLITKGALENVLTVCTHAEQADGSRRPLDEVEPEIRRQHERLSAEGYRTLGVALRDLGAAEATRREDETGMVFVGFLVFHDPPKPGIAATIDRLRQLGISLRMITGDNRLVAANVAHQVGLSADRVLTGSDLHQASDEALHYLVDHHDVFAEVEPNQKERIVRALRQSGHVVGYLGDGINDASALHMADVGVSVDQAVDVAKEAADIVLLERDLDVLLEGVHQGRATFANTLKYVYMATSANFGNMFSVAGASLFLPFLPLLPKQILLMNLLTDLPEMAIATDAVDEELVARPRRWNVGQIRSFMFLFGPLSSLFDFLTFAALLLVFHASPHEFRTAWCLESVISATLVVLIIRTRRPFYRSPPSRYLLGATLAVMAASLALPWAPMHTLLGFAPIPAGLLAAVGVIVLLYGISAEAAKRIFYRWTDGSIGQRLSLAILRGEKG